MPQRLYVDTSELRPGDILTEHGMRVLLRGEPNTFPSYNSGEERTVYAWAGLVLNPEDVKAEGFIPYGWLFPDVWGKGEHGGWGKDFDAEPTWTVQGNNLAHWSIEREDAE
ncbi:hypothetical protein ACWDWS_02485 [Streptomyces sp. NPDC003328]